MMDGFGFGVSFARRVQSSSGWAECLENEWIFFDLSSLGLTERQGSMEQNGARFPRMSRSS